MFDQNAPALVGQFADQPVGLEGVSEPGFRPALIDASLDSAGIDTLSVTIEQWQLAARLFESSFQPNQLRRARFARPSIDIRGMRFGLIRNHREPPISLHVTL